MRRRTVLRTLAAVPLGVLALRAVARPEEVKGANVEELQKNWKQFLADGAEVPSPDQPMALSRDEWRKRLPPEAFDVLRQEGTERAGTSPLNREKREGVFVCAGCGLPLFTSAMKFESGTGWPSFFTTIPGAFKTKRDFKLFLPRTEYHCARCGGHHGHVFDDGPAPTGQRWCNNGVALKFVPKSEKS
ncbi:MAG: peptide-methionine (R)-S-oxide reductase MsrB [Burkholderiales bacterium]|jgi:peptide-methionine (R)-S-oxide reductase|nr:peptide-methionine (R)-S-oxide reductase MsrB [Burkholderiales bacterium]